MRKRPKFCGARHYDPDATCELRYDHEGWHRAEFAPPVVVDEKLVAQVVSWG